MQIFAKKFYNMEENFSFTALFLSPSEVNFFERISDLKR